MTRPKPRPEDELERRLCDEAFPPPDPVLDAVDAYRARFGTTPWMIHIPQDRMPAWLEAIHDAVRTGRGFGPCAAAAPPCSTEYRRTT